MLEIGTVIEEEGHRAMDEERRDKVPRNGGSRGERTGPAAGPRSQTGTHVRNPDADGTGVRFSSTEKEEKSAGENGGQMLNLWVSPDTMTQLVGVQQDLVRAEIVGKGS